MRMRLEGVDDSGNEESRTLLMRRDRALVIWSRLVGFNGTREQILASDAQNLLRIKPYEPLLPISPTILTGTLATVYTSTSRRSRIWCDVVNHGNSTTATVNVVQRVAASGDEFNWYPSTTPVPIGVPIRTGFIHLESGDLLRASCSPASTVTIHVHVDRYNATGDTP
jgi:hypothetical protein